MKPLTLLQVLAAASALALAACAPTPTPSLSTTPSPSFELTPYQARTNTPAPAPFDSGTPTSLPSPTPTPLVHVVAKGQDMFGIALYYGITLDALKAANPDVNPNFLSIGTNLIIPGVVLPTPTVANPTPTPLPVDAGTPNCLPGQDGGIWCFVAVRNPGPGRLESLIARLRLTAANGETLETTAYSLLNLLEPGAQSALAAYFPAPIPAEFQASAEILTALPIPVEDPRYLPAQLEQVAVSIDPEGLSAVLTAAAFVEGDTGAGTVWVAATAYDAAGRIVGVRRWESDQPLPAGERLAVTMQVYSVGPAIARVEALVEARP